MQSLKEQSPNKSKIIVFIIIGLVLVSLIVLYLILTLGKLPNSEFSKELREFCPGKNVQDCYLEFTINKNDQSYCQDMVDNVIAACRDEANAQNQDPSDCEDIRITRSNFNLEDTCRVEIAINSGDISLCNSVESTIFQGDCYLNLIELAGDILYCDKITNEADQYYTGLRSLCYGKIGVIRNDLSVCNSLDPSENFGLWRCYSELAIGLNNPSICEESGLSTSDVERCLTDVEEANAFAV